jgi:hypothetical protein
MKKICLIIVGIYLYLFAAFAQTKDSVTQVKDSTNYKSRKLEIEEINFVSSYYHQEGDNSAVTGGIGTEKLSDYANVLEVRLSKYGKNNLKHEVDANVGIDYYTSASSDNIDPHTISSASHQDVRFYPSLSYGITNEKKGLSITGMGSFSIESDYQSHGFGASVSKLSKDKNREFSAKAQVYLDEVRIILPVELRTATTGGLYGAPNEHEYPWRSRDSYSASFSLSQVVNQRFQAMLLADVVYQDGFLSLPFHRIYFKDGSETTEHLPSTRFKVPIGLRANYFFGDRFIVRTYYRYYQDNWGLKAHTIDIETPIKLTPFFSVSPFYRFYTQTGIRYFAPYMAHLSTDEYYSSNYDLSSFNSHFFGIGIRTTPPKGVLGIHQVTMLELRYGHYITTNTLYADIITLSLKFK